MAAATGLGSWIEVEGRGEGRGMGRWTADEGRGMGALLEGPPSLTTTISSSPAPCRKEKKQRVKTSTGTVKLSYGHLL